MPELSVKSRERERKTKTKRQIHTKTEKERERERERDGGMDGWMDGLLYNQWTDHNNIVGER